MFGLIVLDDVIEEKAARELEALLLSPKFAWYHQKEIVYKPDIAGTPHLIQDRPYTGASGFYHTLYSDTMICSDYFDICKNILDSYVTKTEREPIAEILRMQAFMILRTAPESETILTPHVDSDNDLTIMLYYVNDSDGDTIIFANTFPDNKFARPMCRITPKRGRAIIFSGRYYHSGSLPTQHNCRMAINYNFR